LSHIALSGWWILSEARGDVEDRENKYDAADEKLHVVPPQKGRL
jgi:hypothetical protein